MTIPVFVHKYLPKRSTGINVIIALLAAIILFFILFVSFKNLLFERALNSVSAKFESIHYSLTWKDSRVIQFNRISIAKLMLRSNIDSTTVELDSLSLRFGVVSAI